MTTPSFIKSCGCNKKITIHGSN